MELGGEKRFGRGERRMVCRQRKPALVSNKEGMGRIGGLSSERKEVYRMGRQIDTLKHKQIQMGD